MSAPVNTCVNNWPCNTVYLFLKALFAFMRFLSESVAFVVVYACGGEGEALLADLAYNPLKREAKQ